MKRKLTVAALAAGFAMVTASAPTMAAPDGLEVGLLTCEIEGGFGLVLGSDKDMRCVFDPSGFGEKERYVGDIVKLGIDIGYTGKAVMVWTVFAPTNKLGSGALKGTYSGVAADASVGVGGGANLLIGGSSKTISLQPLSTQAQIGLNAALAVASVELRPGDDY